MAKTLSGIVEVCIFRRISGKPQYLLLQRTDNEDLYPGLWQIVTGSIKKNESAVTAALREVKEETGLNVKRFWSVPVVDSYYDLRNDAVQTVPVFSVEVDDISDVCLSNEHQCYKWLVYKDANKRIVWPGQRQALEIVHKYIIGGKEVARLLEITKF